MEHSRVGFENRLSLLNAPLATAFAHWFQVQHEWQVENAVVMSIDQRVRMLARLRWYMACVQQGSNAKQSK